MSKTVQAKPLTRAKQLAADKAAMSADMIAVAAITGKKADRLAAAPAAMAVVRKLLVGHFRQNPEKADAARLVFRAVTGTEAAEWDNVVAPLLGGTRQNLGELRKFLADPSGELVSSAYAVADAFASLPEWARSTKTDPIKARARAMKLASKDWSKVKAACAALAAALSADFARLDAAEAAPEATPAVAEPEAAPR